MSAIKMIPVILCGGSGTRLWPLSRIAKPKQFLKLIGDFSLLQQTIKRALSITDASIDQVLIVTLESQKGLIEEQISQMGITGNPHILCETSARNTAAAISYAAQYAVKNFGTDSYLWVLPSDHHIGDKTTMKSAYQSALKIAKSNHLVTFGIEPTRPETGYGYIKKGEKFDDAGFIIDTFVEKPDKQTAQHYLDEGSFLWNSGMFLFTAQCVLDEFKAHAPDIHSAVEKSIDEKGQINAQHYAAIPAQPFDKAVMEKSPRGAVIPCDPEWSDIGSWQSLRDILLSEDDGNIIEGDVHGHGLKNTMIKGTEKTIVAIGLDNISIIETQDAILIMNNNNDEALKDCVSKLKDHENKDLI